MKPPGKASVRPKGGRPPPLPSAGASVHASIRPIEVNPAWLEIEPPEVVVTERGTGALGSAAAACVGEAVRVWVGPTGQVELVRPATSTPVGYVEALIVSASPRADLATRLRRR